MAYEIISQNNTTTTLSDGTNTITVPARVTLATSTSYTITEVNNNTATLEGSDGSVIRDVPCVVVLAGGGDSHNKGYFATQAALEEAYPTAEPGDFAIVESTDTVWVWDSDTSNWKDSDTKGQVTSVNNQTGAVTLTASDVGAATAAQGAKADTAVQPGDLATVATTGAYSDLTGTPTIPAAIQVSTMPTAAVGELDKIYQFIGTTDANYTNGYFYKCVSDGQDPATYSWTQTDVQPAPSGLPDQTGQSGKFLTTDGTDASWATVDTLPSQTGQSGKFLTTNGTSASWSSKPPLINATSTWNNVSYPGLSVGDFTRGAYGSVVIGRSNTGSDDNYYAVVIGNEAEVISNQSATGCIAIGYQAKSGANNIYTSNSIAIGFTAVAAGGNAIQIGSGTNNTAGTFQVLSYRVLDSNGTIPEARLADTTNAQQGDVLTLDSNGNAVWQAGGGGGGSTALSLTLAVANWSNNSITVTATGVTASNNVIVSPAPASQSAYTTAGVMCTAQASDSLTFTCTTTPSADLTVTVLII